MRRLPNLAVLLVLALLWPMASGCSIKKTAINMVGNALAESGDTFSSDEDPELVRDALPFSLKLMESLLASSPNHRGLLTATCKGFTMYAYAFLQMEADAIEAHQYDKAKLLRERAIRMYLRARDYGLRGLETRSKGFSSKFKSDPAKALAAFQKKDVEALYWAGLSWMAAVSAGKSDPALMGDLGAAQKLLDRAYALDPDWGQGALHEFYITFDGGRPEAMGGSVARAREHYEKALALSKGLRVSTYLALAESVSVKNQDRKEFEGLLDKALAVDVNADKPNRLQNIVYRKRALWLRSQEAVLFAE